MKTYKKLLFLVMALLSQAAYAQESVNLKFGKPTKEELEMKVYDQDPTASAVVLCRLTTVDYTVQFNGYLVDYREKIRIKVLKPDGARYANVTIPYLYQKEDKSNIKGNRFSLATITIQMGTSNYELEGSSSSLTESAIGNYTEENVEELKAVAYNLVNGKTVKSHLKKSSVVKDTIDDQHLEVRFTIPDVREGTVIEYEYCVHSQLFYLLHDWYAQCEIPVVYARLDMNIPRYLIFNIEEHGIQRLSCQCVTGTLNYKLESDAISAPTTVNTNHYIIVGRDLKAMPKDDYVWNAGDHRAGITAELKSYSLRGMLQTEYAKTWEQVDAMLLDDQDLGKQLGSSSPLADELRQAKIAEIADERERAVAVYQLVMSRVAWNGKYELWPANTVETLKAGKGTNADINMLLIQSLQEVGLTAAPVLLRQRDEGLLPYNFPSLRKLSTFVVGIIPSGGTTVYLDASSADGYLNVLSSTLLVERARLLKKNGSHWVNLQKNIKSQTSTIVESTLSADGKLSGKQTTRYEGVAALEYRLQRDGGKVNGAGEFTPVATEELELSSQGEVSDGQIRVCPFFRPPMDRNPFTAETRLMPVEFPYLQSDKVVVTITPPEGYSLAEVPKHTVISTPDKGIEARFFVSQSEGRVHIQYQLNINRLSHSEKVYQDLRNLYDLFVKYSTEKLVFTSSKQ